MWIKATGQNDTCNRLKASMTLGKKLVELNSFLPRGRKLALWAWRNMAEQWVDILAGHDIYSC